MVKENKVCSYCGKENTGAEKKCRFCGELLNESGQKNSKKNISNKKELTIYDLPNKRSELNERQKEILIKNYPLKGWYKVLVFIFPGIFLIYSRNGALLILMVLIGMLSYVEKIGIIVPVILCAIRLFICIEWESICYSESVNMKKLLVEQENLWNKESKNYDDSTITGHISKWWLLLRIILVIPILIAIICLI